MTMKKAITSCILDSPILDTEYQGIAVSKITKLYYKKFPIKIKLEVDCDKSDSDALIKTMGIQMGLTDLEISVPMSNYWRRMMLNVKRQYVEQYVLRSCQDIVKVVNLNDRTLNVFFKSRQDFEKILMGVSKFVTEIHGVVSREHLELIADPSYKMEFNKKPYYNKFDYRVTVSIAGPRYGIRRSGIYSQALTVMGEFLREQAQESEYKLRSDYNKFNVFCNHDLAMCVLPLAKFSMPTDTQFEVTRRLYNDDEHVELQELENR
jgi:hypothetical protein